mmetsp:Transcript_25742/g.25972  ORF Transcript_25742/g.25972 Transcript_25742/m.25972 type:complete len:177 (+) Transcript_25742:57-587(+)
MLQRCFRMLVTVPAAVTFSDLVVGVEVIVDDSMSPTLIKSDIVLVDKFSYGAHENFLEGDIITIRDPSDPSKIISRRITGFHSDRMYMQRNRNSKEILPSSCWVERDNSIEARNRINDAKSLTEYYNNHDASEQRPVSFELIQGRVFYRIWPLHRYGPIQGGQESYFTSRIRSSDV